MACRLVVKGQHFGRIMCNLLFENRLLPNDVTYDYTIYQ